MLRVASNALIVPPFECAWLSLGDYHLDGACCLQFECKGENDVTIILKPVPGAKRWQHLQRQQGPAGGEHLAVEQNYTIILGSHRNSKLKIEKDGDEKASATGLAGCTVDSRSFTTCWINYSHGSIAIGTGPAGSNLSFQWQDAEQPIPGIRHIGLSCWDKHVSYRNVQLLPPLAAAQLQQLAQQQRQEQGRLLQLQREVQLQEQQQQEQQEQAAPNDSCKSSKVEVAAAAAALEAKLLQTCHVPSLLQLVMDSVASSVAPAAVCHVLQLSELLLPRTQQLYEAAVQLAGGWFGLLVQQHLDDLAGLSVDVMADILHEPLLDVSELEVFRAVAAWCQYGSQPAADAQKEPQQQQQPQDAQDLSQQAQQEQGQQSQQQQQQHCSSDEPCSCQSVELEFGWCLMRPAADVQELLQLVRFAFMPEADRQAVLAHPFTRSCQYVQRCMQEDAQRMRDAHEANSPRGCYTFEQRRLVRPGQSNAAAAGGAAACGPPGSTAPAGDKGAPLQFTSAPRSRVGSWRHFRRRLAPSCKELMYVCDGDCNGVVHYIGTEYGSKQWVNPVASKALVIKASSPPSRYTDPKALVSGQFLNTSFAGPRYIRTPQQPATGPAAAAAAAAAMPSTWWQLDLGAQHRLLCNYYTIRHDGSHDGFVRSWVLQGSNDLQHWLDLRRHLNDSTIRLPGQYGSWPISGPAASMPFRAFRLLLLGPTQSHANPWAFCLSHWELYGYFYKLGSSVAAGGAAGAPVDANAVQGGGTGVAAAAAAAGAQGGVAAG